MALSSCFSYSKMFSKELDLLVPADFGAQTTTILVERNDNMFNKVLKKSLEKNYKGEYLIVDVKEIDASKYADTEKYRYKLGVTEAYSSGPSGPDFKINYHVTLTDRKTGQKYLPQGMARSIVDKHLDAYLARLEQARKK